MIPFDTALLRSSWFGKVRATFQIAVDEPMMKNRLAAVALSLYVFAAPMMSFSEIIGCILVMVASNFGVRCATGRMTVVSLPLIRGHGCVKVSSVY